MLVTTIHRRRVVVAACNLARSCAVRPGLTLAEAQSLCPGLTHADHDPDRDARGLAALGRYLMRFTPAVAPVLSTGLFLDVTGCDRLFGGFESLLHQVTATMARLGLSAHLAIAPTPGAAWALAHTGRIFTEVDIAAALTTLSPIALRIDPAVADALRLVGINTIAQLIAIPRHLLPARFGPDLLARLDQATGRTIEPLVLLDHPNPVAAAMAFDGAVHALEAIWAVLHELLSRVSLDLNRRGGGATLLRATFWCEGEPPVVRDVPLARPSRDVASLFNLLRCATEDARARDGFTAVEVSAPAWERYGEPQSRLIGRDRRDAETEIARLTERLRVRWSHDIVRRAQEVESHLPEKACEMAAGKPASEGPRRPGSTRVRSGPSESLRTGFKQDRSSFPLRLMPCPAEVLAITRPTEDDNGQPAQFTLDGITHVVAHAAGPRRVAGTWWTGHDKTRDYFDVVTPDGRRFWLFRAMPSRRWFLHGTFG